MSGRTIGLRVATAEARAKAARARLSETIGTLQHRASPQTIAQDVAETIKERGVETLLVAVAGAKRRPVAFGAAVTLVGLFLARRRIASFLHRNETAAPPASLSPKRAIARSKGTAS